MIYLKEPTLEEYWYEQKLLADPSTMEYNAGWDVSYEGYHYETGCIDFPKEKWEKDFNRRKESNRFFAYLVRKEDNKFIGKVNFQYSENEHRYNCGIVIESIYRGKGYGKEGLKALCKVAFDEYNLDSLYDSFDETRKALKIFEAVGFKKIKEYQGKRFNKNIKCLEVCIRKEDMK